MSAAITTKVFAPWRGRQRRRAGSSKICRGAGLPFSTPTIRMSEAWPRARARVVTFCLAAEADVRATCISSNWPDRLALTVSHGNESQHIQTRLVGAFWTTSVLAAVACGIACGLDLQTCADALASVEPNL